MTAMPEATPSPLDIPGHFATLPDPRHRAFRGFHLLGDIIAIALCIGTGGGSAPLAIVASVTAYLVSVWLDRPAGSVTSSSLQATILMRAARARSSG